MKRFFEIIIAFLMLVPISADAQSVGVVMSGGGAKGLYHIGVLRALEENGIPIDYISGTSMGSIVGGLYASGYTIEEMEKVALSGDLARWVSGSIDPKYSYFFIDRERITSMIRVSVGVEGNDMSQRPKVLLPGAMMNTAEIDLALNSFFTQASTGAQGDFDKLMIPFRCIGTDIQQHRAVELRSGDLARAIRASMALPVAFPPIEIDSVLMCDGGCYDNFPWKSLDESFHPDIIIGVCCTNMETPLNKNSSVVDQVMSLITKPSDFNLPEGRSVLIQRTVAASTLDFGKAAEIMADGYNDALAAMPEIKRLISRRMSNEEYAQRRVEFRSRCPKATIGEVNITCVNDNQRRIAERMMKIGSRGDEVLHAQEFSENYLSTLANGIARSEFPTFTYNYNTERYDVLLPLSARPHFDIALGGNISSTAFNQAYIGLNYNKIGRVGQSFHLDVLLGPVYTMARLWGRTTFILDKPLYVDYAFNFNIHNTRHGNIGNLTRVDNSAPIRMMENFIALAAGSAFERKSVVEFRLNTGSNSYRYSMDMYEKRQYTHFDYITPAVVLDRSTFNKPLFPTRGSHLMASAMYAYGRDRRDSKQESDMNVGENIDMIRQWWGVKALWEQYVGIDPREIFTLGYAVEGVYTTHPEFDSHEATMLSSPQYAPLLHSRMIYMPEFRADRYLGAGVMPTVRLYDNLYARLSIYGMLRDKFNGSVMHYMSDFSLIYHTPIGPVSLALTKYNLHNKNNLYLTFNFGYAIFGRKGLHY